MLKKTALAAIFFSGLVLNIVAVTIIGTFGGEVLTTLNFPFLSLSRYSEWKLEAVVSVYWVTWVLIRGAFFTFAALISMKQLFNLSDYKWLIVPESILAVSYANFQYDSFMEQSYLFSRAHFFYITFSVFFPFGLWIISLMRKKKKNQPRAS